MKSNPDETARPHIERVDASLLKARIVAIRYEARDVLSYVLAPLSPDRTLPAYTPGAHVDVHLNGALMRSYSLSNGLCDAGCYRLTVQRDPKSRGGSIYMHENLRPGQEIEISPPRNNFELCEDASLSVFIAGGIGVTPFIPMMARLNEVGRRWRLHYCVRTRERAAFIEEIDKLVAAGQGEARFNFDEEPGAALLDLDKVIAELPEGAHTYCCGPTGMLHAYQKAAAGLLSERVHFEFFSSDVKAAAEGGFTVVLQQSGREVFVKSGETIMQAVRSAGVFVDSSCEEGICGACETRVISGEPDHRDMILSERERAEGKTMMICCSGCKSDRLVLDL
ncbi:MAG TPA: PDR/VanB family oxidoreductase [Steroidobacter sp.]|nr:PDR/VanB family oxidoreductase [Steroidobacter sp.]